jgi:hypothetical protein
MTTMPDREAAMEQLEAQRTRSEKPPVPDGEEPTDLIRMPPKAPPASSAPKAEPRPPAPVSRRTGEVLALRAAFDHDNSNSRSASQARRNAARDNDGSWFATVVVGLGLVVVGAAGALLLLPFMPPDVVARWMQVPLPTAAPSVTTAPPSSAPVLAPTRPQRSADDATLAEAGDKEALKRLRARPARDLTAREVAARLIGDAVRRRSELADLADDLGSRRTRANDTVFARAAADARDERTAPEALYVLANWPTIDGANELWAITEAREAPASAQAFAWELLVSRDVRGRASEPLRLAIELRELQETPTADGACERARTALVRAREVADIRSLRLAGLFGQRRGCGAKGTSDCWPCLRRGREIREAMTAVSNRPAPTR